MLLFVTLSALLAASAALPREYPAGVHPAVCPDYPYCDLQTLARFTPDGQPIPQWGRAVYYAQSAPVAYAAAAPADKYPAGLNPADCPNYPYCW